MSWKTATLGVVLNVAAGAFGETAMAACDVDFDIAPAKGLSAAMVRAYAPCPATYRGNYFDQQTETDGEVDACTPVIPQEYYGDATPYRYGSSGHCEVKLQSKLAADCSTLEDGHGVSLGLPAEPCHVTRAKAKCSGIENPLGQPIGSSDGIWTLNLRVRASIEDRSNGPMTVVDLPMIFEFDPPSNGSMKLSGTSAETFVNYGVELPPCTSLEISDITIRDQNQNSFATTGGATRP